MARIFTKTENFRKCSPAIQTTLELHARRDMKKSYNLLMSRRGGHASCLQLLQRVRKSGSG
jgi:hypothetical protein